MSKPAANGPAVITTAAPSWSKFYYNTQAHIATR